MTVIGGTVAVKRGTGKQHERNRRRHGDEYGNQDLVQNGTRLQHRETDHGGDKYTAGPPARAEGRRVHALVEGTEAHQTDGAEQGQAGTNEKEERREQCRPQGQIGKTGHSITSPRMRNFANATVETKPRSEITSAASK